MTTSHPANRRETERLEAVLPAVAAAWAKGELTDLQLAAACMAILRDPSIDLSCRETLERTLLEQAISEKAPASLQAHFAA